MTMGKRLIEEMLLLSAPGPKVFDNVDVNPLLGVILERVSNALEDREPDYSFVTDFCGMPLITRGDRVQLDRALSNIILNAVEAMPQGGEIRIKTEKHNANGESFVKVTIADEGPGMEQEVLEKIFTPHFSTKGERGTGLGLAITAKAISDHAGGISVASEPGKGAVFEVLLPAK
jgi:two-component system sensor histidine kinase AtoS